MCAGGVLGVGESYHDAAVRELAEELGVIGVAIEPLGVGRFDDVESREISHLFSAVTDGPFEFADGEVAEARFVTPLQLTKLMSVEPFLPTCSAMILPLVADFDAAAP